MTIEWRDEIEPPADTFTLDIIRMLDGFKRAVSLRVRQLDQDTPQGLDATEYYAGIYRAIFEAEAIIRSDADMDMRGQLPPWVLRFQSWDSSLK